MSVVANPRPIRSFVRREGRMTSGQQRAMSELWSTFGLDVTSTGYQWDKIFGRVAPVTLEIGFGNGSSLLQQAMASPERDFVGIEVHRPGVGTLLAKIDEHQLKNIRVVCEDAITVLERSLHPQTLDRVQLFFPDPWPKKKHHKRRIVQPTFIELIRSRLQMGGVFHLATDWENYAETMMQRLSAHHGFTNVSGWEQFATDTQRPATKFEQRGERLGHGIWDMMFRRSC